jgi:hypothetical protein
MGARFVAGLRGEREADGGKEPVGLWHGVEGVGQGEVADCGITAKRGSRAHSSHLHLN